MIITCMNKLIDPDRKREIRKIAQNISSQYSLADFSSKDMLEKIANKEKIILKEADLCDISGILYKNKIGWKILVNMLDSQTRKLFTIAHELGHYFLHRTEANRFIDGSLISARDENQKYDQQELEANEFAGSLVMPETEIEKIVKKDNIDEDTILTLAQKFSVSSLAMLTRLRNLKYV
jgi:Zn-dependent peptidase ImmA (M78 family)